MCYTFSHLPVVSIGTNKLLFLGCLTVAQYTVGEVVRGIILTRDEEQMTLQIDDDVIAEASGEQISGRHLHLSIHDGLYC